MLDDTMRSWQAATQRAATLVEAARIPDNHEAALDSFGAEATDLLAMVICAVAREHDVAAAAIEPQALCRALRINRLDAYLNERLAGTGLPPPDHAVRRPAPETDPQRRAALIRRQAQVQQHTRHVVDNMFLTAHNPDGVRVADRVLAPLGGSAVLYPCQIMSMVSWQARESDDVLEIMFEIRSERGADYAFPSDMLLDVSADGSDQRQGRGTRAHALRCAVADLRRAADGVTRTNADAVNALADLAQRSALYASIPDLQLQLTATAAALLTISAPPKRQPFWQRRPTLEQQVLASVRQARDSLRHAVFTDADRERFHDLLTEQARTLEAANL